MLLAAALLGAQESSKPQHTQIPNGKIFGDLPGNPRRINNLPAAAAISPDARYVVFVHSGFGAYSSGRKQSLTVLNLETNTIRDFPDERLGIDARQTYFLGLAFGVDGNHLYVSMASLSDPLGKNQGDTGNGIAVYRFENGEVTPDRFLPLAPRTEIPSGKVRREEFKDVTYPAGLSVGMSDGVERILVASNNSDESLLLNTSDGKIVHRFDLSIFKRIPASLPYTAVMTSDGKRGFVSLWNGSAVAELDLLAGRVSRFVSLGKPARPLEGGSHPTALLLSRDNSRLFVALTNRDEIDVLDTNKGDLLYTLSTKLAGQSYGGSDPESLALSSDEKTLYSANAISDCVAVFDLSQATPGKVLPAEGFIPTDWYPTVVAATGTDLVIGSAKGQGSGPNPDPLAPGKSGRVRYPYGPAMTNGSLARIPLNTLHDNLSSWTETTLKINAAQGNVDQVPFSGGKNKIRHVIYIIKENRTYDQLFGDLAEGNGDAHLAMYGEDITPNQHRLARQFGILDNFYDSGDVSGDGHIWSTSASISDYVQKTWPIGYRGHEHTYDSEGEFLAGVAAEDELPYAGEPPGGFLWKNFATHDISYRHYGEFIITRWCNAPAEEMAPDGPPDLKGVACRRSVIKKGEPLESNVGEPHGAPSPYPWDIPVLAKNVAAQVELRGHFDPRYPDFEIAYPDQLRVDEFLNEFNASVETKKSGKDTLPQFILLRLPNDHTAGGMPGRPRPTASVADNDLALGRVVEAVSHSPYWDDTAILVLEDDAQDGPDHVDSHRSIALVISKYAPLNQPHVFVDHTFYTTINMVRTIESLLGAPPMNANDARAAVMAALFSGPGTQAPFNADYRNRENGRIFEMNTKEWKQGKNLDFSHADAADHVVLNKYLWEDRMGSTPMPAPQHNVFPASSDASKAGRSGDRD
jgi:DNA-binding beta-propeller fold protein YncE